MSNSIRVRACLAIVKDNKILLVPHYKTDAGAVQWVIPGGKLEFGESLQEAAIREFFEETGLQAKVTGLLDVSEVILSERPYHSITITFSGDVTNGGLRPEANHPYGEKMPRWFSMTEVKKVEYHPEKTVEKALDINMGFVVRPATPEDANAVGELSKEFVDYLRALGDPSEFSFSAEAYLRDGFGPSPAFAGLVAEREGEILGYLLYHQGYEMDEATRILHIIDLYVRKRCRRQGVGRVLMGEAARICRQLGGSQLFWSVYVPNKLACAFYESLGARYTKDLKFMRLDV